jgi:hypothetical protein
MTPHHGLFRFVLLRFCDSTIWYWPVRGGVQGRHHLAMLKVTSTGTKYVNRVIQTTNSVFSGNCGSGGNSACYVDSCTQAATCSVCDVIHHDFGRLAVLRFTPGATTIQCSADCYPDTPNGIVDIDDLILGVINHWGIVNPTTFPNGIRADVNDDGVVNIDDLTYVINHFGSCSPNDEEELGGGDGRGGSSMQSMGGGENGPEELDIPAIVQSCIDQCGGSYECLVQCLQNAGVMP